MFNWGVKFLIKYKKGVNKLYYVLVWGLFRNIIFLLNSKVGMIYKRERERLKENVDGSLMMIKI